MPASPSFLFVRFPARGLIIGEHALRHPGTRIDSIHDVEALDFGHLQSALTWVRGLPGEAFDAMLAELRERYGRVDVLAADRKARDYLLRLVVRSGEIQNKPLATMTRFVGEFPLWWDHVTADGYEVRGQLESVEQGVEAAERMRAFYTKAGWAVTSRIGPLPPEEQAVRDQLLAWRREPPAPKPI